MKVALFFVALCASLVSAGVAPPWRCAPEHCAFVMMDLVTRDVPKWAAIETKLMAVGETGHQTEALQGAVNPIMNNMHVCLESGQPQSPSPVSASIAV
ncbi:hypothetical protein DHEL01_v211793 [Diaporthe helianthi]|uniref:Uncharacterized protein n=1 Tax=Diaporthe helianthi TaxID=158607 RepID=A0A2P5HHU3_DIAHE|nr:hypothetical protein DHEL01_v211793 [Diaporthe helianthi]